MAIEQKTFVVKAKVFSFTEAKPDNKTHQVLFVTDEGRPEGCPNKPTVYADKTIWSSEDFPEDHVGEMTFDMIPKKEPGQFFFTLVKWNAKEKAPYDNNRNGGRGRGGGGGYQKTVDEIHGPNLAGIVKSSIESCMQAGKVEMTQIGAVIGIGMDKYFGGIATARGLAPVSSPSESKEEAK